MGVLAASLAFGSGCKKSVEVAPGSVFNLPEPMAAQPRLQTMKLWLGPQVVTAELALTAVQQQTGMMFRTNMAEGEGMLFAFPMAHQASFWMKNTCLPLSAAYIDPAGVILEIHELKPFDTNAVVAASDRIQYVLEMRPGWFQRNGVSTGAVVRTEHGPLGAAFSPGR